MPECRRHISGPGISKKQCDAHQLSTPKAFPKAVAIGPMRPDTLSLVAAIALRILSTTAEACRR